MSRPVAKPSVAALAIALLGTLVLLLVSAPRAAAAAPLQLGTADAGYVDATGARREKLYQETVNARAGVVRLNAFWFRIAADPRLALLPGAQSNPANPLYDFATLDAAVRDATRRGLQVILTLQRAPR